MNINNISFFTNKAVKNNINTQPSEKRNNFGNNKKKLALALVCLGALGAVGVALAVKAKKNGLNADEIKQAAEQTKEVVEKSKEVVEKTKENAIKTKKVAVKTQETVEKAKEVAEKASEKVESIIFPNAEKTEINSIEPVMEERVSQLTDFVQMKKIGEKLKGFTSVDDALMTIALRKNMDISEISVESVEAAKKLKPEILEQMFDVFDVYNLLKNADVEKAVETLNNLSPEMFEIITSHNMGSGIIETIRRAGKPTIENAIKSLPEHIRTSENGIPKEEVEAALEKLTKIHDKCFKKIEILDKIFDSKELIKVNKQLEVPERSSFNLFFCDVEEYADAGIKDFVERIYRINPFAIKDEWISGLNINFEKIRESLL